MIATRGEKGNNAFPGFYFGIDSFIYNRVMRIGVSICISVICILFFVIALFLKISRINLCCSFDNKLKK